MMNVTYNKGKSVITFEFEGLTEVETHRFRENMDLLIQQGFFNLHDGKGIAHFNFEGKIKEIGFDFTKWRYEKTRNPAKKPHIDSIGEARRRIQSAMAILESVDNQSVDL